jgi:putative membrane protein
LLAGIGAWLFEPLAGIAAAALGGLGLLSLLRWRKHNYIVGDEALFVSRGLLKRRLWIVPFERAQVIDVARGPVQRPLRLASLIVDTAGASAVRPAEIVDLDAGDAAALSADLLARFHGARARRRLQPA